MRRAVEELFNVKVLRVHTQNRKGKPRRTRFQHRLHEGLEEGDRHARRRTPDRFLLGALYSRPFASAASRDDRANS